MDRNGPQVWSSKRCSFSEIDWVVSKGEWVVGCSKCQCKTCFKHISVENRTIGFSINWWCVGTWKVFVITVHLAIIVYGGSQSKLSLNQSTADDRMMIASLTLAMFTARGTSNCVKPIHFCGQSNPLLCGWPAMLRLTSPKVTPSNQAICCLCWHFLTDQIWVQSLSYKFPSLKIVIVIYKICLIWSLTAIKPRSCPIFLIFIHTFKEINKKWQLSGWDSSSTEESRMSVGQTSRSGSLCVASVCFSTSIDQHVQLLRKLPMGFV